MENGGFVIHSQKMENVVLKEAARDEFGNSLNTKRAQLRQDRLLLMQKH